MTPQERQLVDELFDRLARLEQAPREPDAEAAITDGLRRAPHATYALVQTVLVQDEALKQAHARIQELEGGDARPQQGGFLDSMRDALLGQPQSRGSVPNVSPGQRPVWNSGQVINQQPFGQQVPNAPAPGGFGGGSFLGTAAAAAAGMIGGSILMNSFRGMMGNNHQSFGDTSGASANPWSNDRSSSGSNGDLARDAGIDDIGKNAGNDQRQNFASNDTSADNDDDDDDFDAGDFEGGGDSDYA
jgi:hypothetical protein